MLGTVDLCQQEIFLSLQETHLNLIVLSVTVLVTKPSLIKLQLLIVIDCSFANFWGEFNIWTGFVVVVVLWRWACAFRLVDVLNVVVSLSFSSLLLLLSWECGEGTECLESLSLLEEDIVDLVQSSNSNTVCWNMFDVTSTSRSIEY